MGAVAGSVLAVEVDGWVLVEKMSAGWPDEDETAATTVAQQLTSPIDLAAAGASGDRVIGAVAAHAEDRAAAAAATVAEQILGGPFQPPAPDNTPTANRRKDSAEAACSGMLADEEKRQQAALLDPPPQALLKGAAADPSGAAGGAADAADAPHALPLGKPNSKKTSVSPPPKEAHHLRRTRGGKNRGRGR